VSSETELRGLGGAQLRPSGQPEFRPRAVFQTVWVMRVAISPTERECPLAAVVSQFEFRLRDSADRAALSYAKRGADTHCPPQAPTASASNQTLARRAFRPRTAFHSDAP
jgi:hypothetical protein